MKKIINAVKKINAALEKELEKEIEKDDKKIIIGGGKR